MNLLMLLQTVRAAYFSVPHHVIVNEFVDKGVIDANGAEDMVANTEGLANSGDGKLKDQNAP